MMHEVYLLWGQYYDKSGETFVCVYESREEAEQAKDAAEKLGASMQVRIQPLSLVKEKSPRTFRLT